MSLDELEKEVEYLDSQMVYREIIMRTFNKDVDKKVQRHFNENGRVIWTTSKRLCRRCRREKKLLNKGKIPKE